MRRRTFLRTAAATGAAALTVPALAAGDRKPRECFELRSYSLRSGKRPLMDAFLQKALIPALNRTGSKPVGAFYENADSDKPVAWILIPFKTPAEFAGLSDRLVADREYQSAAASYLSAPATDAVYDRIDSSLLRGIAGLPGLAVPEKKMGLFNLRIYESHNEAAAAKKIEMFNQGELAIFRRVGLTPVLFGEALVGPRLPNLTYLLAFSDDAARQAAWKTFGADPEWKKLRAIPEYEDKRIVSKITNRLLVPAEFSQV